MTDSNNIDKALAYLGSSISSLIDASKAPADLTNLHERIAKRSLSGDHINGGKIVNFSSQGITDKASSEQIYIDDEGVKLKTVVDLTLQGTLSAQTVKAAVLEVGELRADIQLDKTSPLEFKAGSDGMLYGKGLLWSGQGYTKQFIFSKPDHFFSSETISVDKGKGFSVGGASVLTETELGPTVSKSSLREVGRLKGLIVDGGVVIDSYIVYNNLTSRLGLGIEEPNAALSVAEDGIEVMLGTADNSRGIVGTYASSPFDIVTDNTSRVSIGTNGNILLGNRSESPIEVSIHGKLAVGVKNRDPRADLHVAGAIKYNDRIHQYAPHAPTEGTYTRGDIVWNTDPELGRHVGWVCVTAGVPGTWLPFGDIRPAV